jgi:hypothetical protein
MNCPKCGKPAQSEGFLFIRDKQLSSEAWMCMNGCKHIVPYPDDSEWPFEFTVINEEVVPLRPNASDFA